MWLTRSLTAPAVVILDARRPPTVTDHVSVCAYCLCLTWPHPDIGECRGRDDARAPGVSIPGVTARALVGHYARGCAAALRAGYQPPALAIYGPVMYPEEVPLLSAPAGHARLIGGDGQYRHTSLLLLGSPAVVVAGLAAQGFINHRRRRQARRDAVSCWLPCGEATVIATTQRLLCNRTDDGWISFWFQDVDEFYPELQHYAVTIGFAENCATLRLHGPAIRTLALWSAVGILGDRWADDPRLAALLN